jgi:Tol biopolymer transport system component
MELTELTGEHGVDSYNLHPSWSPDGKWIVYASDMVPLNNQFGNFDLYLVQSDGQNWHQLTFGGHSLDPDWSPDGQWIAYIINNEIGLISPDGSKSQILTYQPGIKNLPTWSPDGRFLAYLYDDFKNVASDQGLEVWVLEVQTRRSYRVATDASSLRLTTLSWSPDGKRIIFSGHQNQDCTKLYSVENKENGQVETLSLLPAGPQYGMAWSPEGDWISYVVAPAFTCTKAATDAGGKFFRLFIARPDGSNRIELADLPGIEPIQPEWGPLPKK